MSMINNWAMSTVQRNTAVEVVKECIKKIGPAKNEANIIKNKWNEISQNLIGMIKVNRICPVASYTGLKKHFTLKLTQVLNIHIPISKFSADPYLYNHFTKITNCLSATSGLDCSQSLDSLS